MTELPGLAAVIIVIVAVLGLAVGSFLNVVVYRVPLGLSVVAPSSACPGCGAGISARDNIPILSWVILRGRCRHCAEPISIRYVVVEAVTAVVFLVIAIVFVPPILSSTRLADAVSSGLVLAAYLYLGAISVALTAIDLDVRRLPNAIVLPSYAVGVVLLGVAALVAGDVIPFARALAGSGILVVFYVLLAVIKPGGMGLGDVKLAGVLGMFMGFIGWGSLVSGTLGAFLLGGIVGIVLIVARGATRGTAIPFGPWMCAGAWVGIIAGEPLAAGYLGLVGL